MLSLKNRLKKEKEIERVLKKKGSIKSNLFVFKKSENFLGETRFCFIVSEKISKKATVRNKIKRRMREIVRESLPKIKKGFDIVIIALPGIEKKEFKEIKEDLLRVFLKAEILK